MMRPSPRSTDWTSAASLTQVRAGIIAGGVKRDGVGAGPGALQVPDVAFQQPDHQLAVGVLQEDAGAASAGRCVCSHSDAGEPEAARCERRVARAGAVPRGQIRGCAAALAAPGQPGTRQLPTPHCRSGRGLSSRCAAVLAVSPRSAISVPSFQTLIFSPMPGERRSVSPSGPTFRTTSFAAAGGTDERGHRLGAAGATAAGASRWHDSRHWRGSGGRGRISGPRAG